MFGVRHEARWDGEQLNLELEPELGPDLVGNRDSDGYGSGRAHLLLVEATTPRQVSQQETLAGRALAHLR